MPSGTPYSWTVDHDARTIVVTGRGEGTTADTLRLIDELGDTLHECAGYNFLYDSVALRIASSPADMVKVADALFDRTRASFPRFAIVVPPERIHLARMFTALADPYGVKADVFTTQEDARRWLGLAE